MLYFTQNTYGRPCTEEETTAITNYFNSPSVASVTMAINFDMVSSNIGGVEVTYRDNFVNLFSTEAAADGYLALVNGFTPPPQVSKKLS